MNHTSSTRTSDILKSLITKGEVTTITLQDISLKLSDRGFAIGILLFAIPNAIPLGIPGISSICAVPIALFALQMMFARHHIWLPRRFANISFSTKLLNFGIEKALPTFIWFERFLKPRATRFAEGIFEQLCGLTIVIHAAIIFLPIPFGNFLPGICMCMLAFALLENDGYLIIIALIISISVVLGMSYTIFTVLMSIYSLIF